MLTGEVDKLLNRHILEAAGTLSDTSISAHQNGIDTSIQPYPSSLWPSELAWSGYVFVWALRFFMSAPPALRLSPSS
jgi:hypothetical protein